MAAENQQLTSEDKEFIKLHEEGVKNSEAFRQAYPSHAASLAWGVTKPGTPDRQKAAEMVRDAAKQKLLAKYMKKALATYQDKMEEFSVLALETATDLVKNARSEKVRADLAIEGIRHKIGSPTVKVAVSEKRVVTLTFGTPAPSEPVDDHDDAIEGELV